MAVERLVVGVDIALHDICAELPTTEVDRLARGRFEVRSCERGAKDERAQRRSAEKGSRATDESSSVDAQESLSHDFRPSFGCGTAPLQRFEYSVAPKLKCLHI